MITLEYSRPRRRQQHQQQPQPRRQQPQRSQQQQQRHQQRQEYQWPSRQRQERSQYRPANTVRQQQYSRSRYQNQRQQNHIAGTRRNPSVRNSWQDSRPRVNGIDRSTDTGNIRGPTPPSHITFVSMLEAGSAEELSNYMRDKGVNIRDIEKKSHPDSRFNSFKISISVLDKKKFITQCSGLMA